MKNIPKPGTIQIFPTNKVVLPEWGEKFVSSKPYKKGEFILTVPTKQPTVILEQEDTIYKSGVICEVLGVEKDGDRTMVALVGLLRVDISKTEYTPIEQTEPEADYEILSKILLEEYGIMAGAVGTPNKGVYEAQLIHNTYGNAKSKHCDYGTFVDLIVCFALDKGEELEFQVDILKEKNVKTRFKKTIEFFKNRGEEFGLRRSLAVDAGKDMEEKNAE